VFYSICPECAYTSDDTERSLCEYCRTELLKRCPSCGKPIQEKRAIHCRECGTKLRVSITPIQ
jgi:predicted amidophosphoribosyltransferase